MSNYTWAKTTSETIRLALELAAMQSVLGGTALKPHVNEEVGAVIEASEGIDTDTAILRLRELEVAIALREFQKQLSRRTNFSYRVIWTVEARQPVPSFEVQLREIDGTPWDLSDADHQGAIALARAIHAVGWDPVDMVIDPL